MRAMISFTVLALAAITWGIRASDTNSVPIASTKRVEPWFEVFGSVHHEGIFGWTNGVTVLDGIRAAGGFNHFAGSRIVIHHSDGSVDIFSRKLLEITNQPPGLRPRDEVVVFKKQKVY